MPLAARVVDDFIFLEKRKHFFSVMTAEAAERFPVGERELEGGAFEMVHQNQEIVRIDPRMLGTPAKEVLGV